MNIFSSQKSIFSSVIKSPFLGFFAIVLIAIPNLVDAACSPYIGQATLNEFFKDQANQSNDPDDFTEVKILNDSIPLSTYGNWTIKICEQSIPANNNDEDGCSLDILLSSFTDTSTPWLVLKGAGLNTEVGQHINLKTGFDATLLDSNGDLIDYISVDGYTEAINGIGCNLTNLVFDYTASSPGASDKIIFRSPDGTGAWDSAPSATAPPTEDTTNDPLPPPPAGETYPFVTINNVSLSTPGTALFTVSLTDASGNPTTFSQAVTISYFTQDGTATVADNDYTAVPLGSPLTVTIAAGQTSTTLTINSPSSTYADTNEYFYAVLQAVQNSAANGGAPNASISKHYGTATLDGPLGEWNFDSCNISAPFDVKDTSGNNYHATPHNGTSTSLGRICSAGSFDGSNDYVSIPSFPNLTTSFTISAWINPNAINNDQRIFVDDESNSGGFAFSLGDGGDGRLRFFSRNVNPIILDSSPVISAGNWYHVVAVHDSINKTRQIFVNGADVTGGPQTYTGTWSSDNGLASIGGETDGAGSEASAQWRFDGLIDEVKVYYRALSAAEISSYYTNPNPNNRICPICFAPTCDTFRDEFSSQDYDLQAGTVNWTSNWIETGETTNPATGDIRILSGELQFQGDGASPSIEREADLSGYDSATLTFDYFTSGNWESSDNIRIYFSNDGGSNWILQDTISNDQTSNTYSAVLAASNLTNNFRVRFVEGANNWRERFHIDNIQINACVTPKVHHIEFIHDGSALTCNPEQIKIKACSDNAVPCTPYTSTVTINLLPTGWVGGDSVSFSNVTGSTNYYLQHTTVGQITFDTSSEVPAASSSAVCRNSDSGPAAACTMDFHDSGFIFDVTTQTSCVISPNIKISAVRKSPTTEQCIPFFNGKTAALKLWTAYSNPNSGTNQATLNYSGTDYPLSTTAPGTDVNMTFDANGEATFTLNYPDAGQLDLNATYAGSVATLDDGLSMSGNQTYVTKPAKFYIYSDDVNAACPSADPTLPDCNPAFRKTGESFNLKIRAACDNAGNTVTPNFQLNGLTIVSNLVQPSTGINANLDVTSFNITAADNGEHVISSQNIDQVGVFTFTAELPAAGYFGETIIGSATLNTSANIGRFTPDHFNTLVTHGCSGGSTFTYSKQPFSVTASARNQNDAITVNYHDDFAFGVTLSDSNALSTGSLNNNTIPESSFTSAIEGASVGAGISTDLNYEFSNKETVPGIIQIKATDITDTLITSSVTEGSTEIRSGRTRLENAFGSELTDLPVPARVEFFNTNGFEINTADTCSAVTATLTDIGVDPILVGTGLSGETCIWDDDTESGANNCTNAAILPGPVTSQFEEPPVAGSFNLNLLAPGANNTGDIGITFTSPAWLQFDWDGNGTHDNDPTGVASFGLYRGDDRIIYWREVFD